MRGWLRAGPHLAELRQNLERAIAALIEVLDALDAPTEDIEPNCDDDDDKSGWEQEPDEFVYSHYRALPPGYLEPLRHDVSGLTGRATKVCD